MKAAAQIGDAEGRNAAAEHRHDRAQQHADDAHVGTQSVGAQARMERRKPMKRRPADVNGERCRLTAASPLAGAALASAAGLALVSTVPRPTSRDGPARRGGMAVQRDFHRNTLHHFREIAGRVVGREQREGASGSGRPTVDMTRQNEIGKSIDGDAAGWPMRTSVICVSL